MTAPDRPRLWILTDRAESAERWRGVLDRLAAVGERVERLGDLKTKEEGVALVDWDLLAEAPGRALRNLRERAPQTSVIIVASDEDLQSGGIADALAAGALDVMNDSSSDDSMAELIGRNLKTLFAARGRGMLESEWVRVDQARRIVSVRQGRGWSDVENLTPKEFGVLVALIEAAGRPVSRQALFDEVWGARSGSVNPEALDKQMASLRRKMGSRGKRIKTVRGVGYLLE